MVAVAVDVGRMFLVRSQLQTAVDAGALAAGVTLRHDPNDIDAAVAAAQQFVQLNRVGWLVTVPEDAITIEAGDWDAATRTFTVSTVEPNAVRVAAAQRREPLVFACVFGINSFSIPRHAIATSNAEKLDIMLVLDLSESMEDEGRIEALQTAAPEFVDFVEEVGGDDRIGVMGYGAQIGKYDPIKRGHNGAPYLNSPKSLFPSNDSWVGVLESNLTADFDRLRTRVLDTGSLLADKYNSYTPTGAAIRDAAHYLNAQARADVRRIMVLMSDGYANKPDGKGRSYALQMAQYAKGLEITIYTISLGKDADQKLMADIAAATGGAYFHAGGSDHATLSATLSTAFEDVVAAIRRTQLVQ